MTEPTRPEAERATAFVDRWIDKFGDVYSTTPPRSITWFTGTASPELANLVVDGTLPRGSRVLEIGSGVGVEAIFLATHGMSVVAVDASPAALETAAKIASIYQVDVEWVEGDALDLPVEDGAFDFVNDSFVFHNLRPEARARYASEVARALTEGGRFCVRGYSDWMTPGSGPWRLTAREILETFMPVLDCEELRRYRGFPTEKRPDQWHWFSLWRKATSGAPGDGA